MNKQAVSLSQKQASLDALRDEIISNAVCPDLADQATQLVFGSGNADAEVMFVGEAPGRNEDLEGKPFVGASGKVLDELLGSIGLERDLIYITNIVKYRPPNNRDPSPQEIEEFMPYLVSQLEIIEPSVIVPLGKHALSCFLPKALISESHGQVYRVADLEAGLITNKQGREDVCVIPQYHPAAIIYNRSLMATVKEDFKTITKLLIYQKQQNKEK
jgi:uracil-DNA glycosylase